MDLESLRNSFTIFLVIAALGAVGAYEWLMPLYVDAPRAVRASIAIGVMSTLGTLTLAAATFYSVYQTNNRLELERRRHEQPLVRDVLAEVIQPAVDAIDDNIEMQESDTDIDWLYVEGPLQIDIPTFGRPKSVFQSHDPAALARVQSNHPALYAKMESHDAKIKEIGQIADRIQTTLQPRIEQQLRDAGYEVDDDGQTTRVITSAIFKDVEEFGESHELYDFWETYGTTLKSDGREMADDDFETLQNAVAEYETLCNKLRADLIDVRRSLQRQYNISSEEIESEEGDRF